MSVEGEQKAAVRLAKDFGAATIQGKEGPWSIRDAIADALIKREGYFASEALQMADESISALCQVILDHGYLRPVTEDELAVDAVTAAPERKEEPTNKTPQWKLDRGLR